MTGGGNIESSGNAEKMIENLKLPANFDRNYQSAALAYNQEKTNRSFLARKAEMQSVYHAAWRGVDGGLYYGTGAGFVSAIYSRKISQIPKVAIGSALVYSLLLGSSAWFRMEL
jgi:hypothetical protein